MADLIRKPLAWLAGLLLMAAALLWFSGVLSGARRAEVTARFEASRGDAAVRSGADAANTIGERGSAEHALDKEITRAQDQVRTAPDTGAADSAARNGLCGISTDYCQ
ncbi:hypothetical protein [Altererythrobacter sp. Root672]|uniref:hypothetical protein n=1 Tax=Altererythrobacter sp. Root672 TaxID=1736584 RepID=UPI0006F56BA7|nr:hypothetical protein [Altererythrobacter sp. Root672]KRA83061.1 hypothetical protein ASD76_03010 [Altererythrobacter sp. Root672]